MTDTTAHEARKLGYTPCEKCGAPWDRDCDGHKLCAQDATDYWIAKEAASRALVEQREHERDAAIGVGHATLADLAASRALVEQMRKALDAAMQYVAPKDRDWIESLAAVPDRNEDARAGGAEGDTP